MAGINLKTMEVRDMLDIVHALYEEDSLPMFEEHQKLKSDIRVSMWRHIYHTEYKYPFNDLAAAGGATTYGGTDGLPPEDSLLPEPDAPKPRKPYVPPTDYEQYESAGLDAPLGGLLNESM